jgi:hypothetical protein
LLDSEWMLNQKTQWKMEKIAQMKREDKEVKVNVKWGGNRIYWYSLMEFKFTYHFTHFSQFELNCKFYPLHIIKLNKTLYKKRRIRDTSLFSNCRQIINCSFVNFPRNKRFPPRWRINMLK